jgi:hypothetical protein
LFAAAGMLRALREAFSRGKVSGRNAEIFRERAPRRPDRRYGGYFLIAPFLRLPQDGEMPSTNKKYARSSRLAIYGGNFQFGRLERGKRVGSFD